MNGNQSGNINLQFLAELLDQKIQSETYRELPDLHGKIDFCSNDYLGLSRIPHEPGEAGQPYGHGATGSRLISGNHPIAEETEQFIARFHGAEAGLMFNCGYMANVGLFTSIASRNDTIIHDEYIHASIIDGIRLSGARRLKFKHNDVASLERMLKGARESAGRHSNIFVCVESIYSMDGDIAPLQTIATHCLAAGAHLVVDEAHALGVKGDMGKGLVSQLGLESNVFARVFSFGKSLGLHGAVVLGSRLLIDVLINYSRPFIYTTALPPATFQLIRAHYSLLDNDRISVLKHRIAYFMNGAKRLRHLRWSFNDTPIQLLFMDSNASLRSLADHLQKNNFAVKAILSPTVSRGHERIRLSMHSFNTEEQIDELLGIIGEYTESIVPAENTES